MKSTTIKTVFAAVTAALLVLTSACGGQKGDIHPEHDRTKQFLSRVHV
ncbi:hypothetical protein [Bifidobacterium vespertilionis]|nr:hypothetical protein [Bifidobacterium vespertilionis]MBT1179813.1 hypothetical protein [Bifidobacterium vespertilionis]